jgi:hypothetical protein
LVSFLVLATATQKSMKLSFPLFALSLLHGQVSQSKDLKPSSLRKAEVVSDVEKQGQDLSLLLQSKAIAAESVHTSVNVSHSIARHLEGTASWAQVGSNIEGDTNNDSLGVSVALSSDGMILAIGGENNFVRIFERKNGEWEQLGSDIVGEAADDRFGYSRDSISLSSDGSIVAVGATENDGNGNNASGHVRIFEWNNGTWNQLGVDIDGEAESDRSGSAVSLSSNGKIVAIGATGNDNNGASSGHVRIFFWNITITAWEQMGSAIVGEAAYDAFGFSVSLSSDGSTVAIGSTDVSDISFYGGHVRIFEWKDEVWNQLGNAIEGEAGFDRSGSSVALSGDGLLVAIGAKGNGGGSGHVRIFELKRILELNITAWEQLGSDIDGEAACDQSGYSIGLSSDGLTVAVGAPYNGAGSEGHVRIFEWINEAWNQVGDDIDAEPLSSSYIFYGQSVALSSDGSTVAIGGRGSNDSASFTGIVKVYNFPTPTSGVSGDPHCKCSLYSQ